MAIQLEKFFLLVITVLGLPNYKNIFIDVHSIYLPRKNWIEVKIIFFTNF